MNQQLEMKKIWNDNVSEHVGYRFDVGHRLDAKKDEVEGTVNLAAGA